MRCEFAVEAVHGSQNAPDDVLQFLEESAVEFPRDQVVAAASILVW